MVGQGIRPTLGVGNSGRPKAATTPMATSHTTPTTIAAVKSHCAVEATASVAEQLVIRPVDAEVAALAELTALTRRLDR